MASEKDSGTLSGFAETAGLSACGRDGLPRTGSLLSRPDLKVEGAVQGTLPGAAEGTVLHSTYETRSDDTTTVHRHTAVVIRVPESIGYAPYLQIGIRFGPAGALGGRRMFEPAPGVQAIVDEGVDEGWLNELFSPAFAEWLQRSPKDFGAELADGVLVVIRDGHLADRPALTNLCADAARIADAVRDESVEEAGGGSVAKAAEPGREERLAATLLPRLSQGGPPGHVESELAAAGELARSSSLVQASAVRSTLLWMLGINVIGGGIYGLLLTVGDPLINILIYQVILLVLVGTLVFRSRTSAVAKRAAEDAFYAGYADSHGLRPVEPLRFAAEHSQAGLPGRPLRVYEGPIGGAPGHLMLTGNGRERGHSIALVRGPRGPVATTELNVSAPGVSTAALDGCVETLLLDLETAPSG